MISRLTKTARIAYLSLLGLFFAGIFTQVYLAGLAAVAKKITWTTHIEVGYLVPLPLLLMLIIMFPAKVSRRAKWMTFLLLVVLIVQVLLIWFRTDLPFISALHPVLALVDFLLAWWLGRQVWAQMKI
ncbi:MAG: DUF6220 domain-containing protein [Anaerolineales bacterium]|jgi:hypothetical protein